MLEKAKEEYHEWVEMHDGMVPSEDLKEFEKDAAQRWWLVQQAEEKIQLEERVKELEAEKGVSKNFEAGIIRENQRYKQALEFYADEENYKDMGIPAPEGIEVTNISEDEGFIARQALQGGNENE